MAGWYDAAAGWRQAHQGITAQDVADGVAITNAQLTTPTLVSPALSGTMTGAASSRIKMPDGTLALPSYGFTSDDDTGFSLVSGVLSTIFGGAATLESIAGIVRRADAALFNMLVEPVVKTAVAATTLAHDASKAPIIYLRASHAAGVDLSGAAPEIEAGAFEGQLLILKDDDDSGGSLVINDRLTVATSGVATAGTSTTMAAADICMFMWDAESSLWVQIAARLNIA